MHGNYVLICILRCEVPIDLVDGLHVRVAALTHDCLGVPLQVEAEGDPTVPETVNANLWETVLLAEAVDAPVKRGWIRKD